VAPKELSVFDEQHPRPKKAIGVEGLRKYLTAVSKKQIAALDPEDAKSLKEFQRVIGTALRVMVQDRLPKPAEVESKFVEEQKEVDGVRLMKLVLGRKGGGEQIPAVQLRGQDFDGAVVIWIHPDGKASLFHEGKVIPTARKILDKKTAILAPDVFLTGEFQGAKPLDVNQQFGGFTFGYNRPLLANRVHDILTTIGFAKGPEYVKKVHLVGFGKAGPWALLARSLCGDVVVRTAVDVNKFDFDNVKNTSDEMMLPGALKYGGLRLLAGPCAPAELFLHNCRTIPGASAYSVGPAIPIKFTWTEVKITDEEVIDWLLR
jgi:hypothetical protein